MAYITRREPKKPIHYQFCGRSWCNRCYEDVEYNVVDTKATDEEMHLWLTEELAKDAAAKEIDPIVTDKSQDFIHTLLSSVHAENNVTRERAR